MGGGSLPAVNGKKVIRALEKAGFVVSRTKGSHHMLAHESDPTRIVIVPVHGNPRRKDRDPELDSQAGRLNRRAIQGLALTNPVESRVGDLP